MNMDERIARINALYHKSQNEGLTEEEKATPPPPRKESEPNVQTTPRGQLDNTTTERPTGPRETRGEKYGGKPRRES